MAEGNSAYFKVTGAREQESRHESQQCTMQLTRTHIHTHTRARVLHKQRKRKQKRKLILFLFLERNKGAISTEWPLRHLAKAVILRNKCLRGRYWHLYQNILKRLAPFLAIVKPLHSSWTWSFFQFMLMDREPSCQSWDRRSKGTGSQVCIHFQNELNYIKSAAFSLWT